jgi:transcriptional regulator with XRE-family HTH domain
MVNVAKLPDRESPAGYVAGEVRAHLARRGWSGSRLASELGQTQAWISRRLTGDVAFDANELARIGDLLDVHPGEFFPDFDEVLPARQRWARRSFVLPDLDSNQEPIDFKSKYISLRRPEDDQLAAHRRAKQNAHDAVEYREGLGEAG